MSVDIGKLFTLIPEIYSSLRENGLLLVSTGSARTANVMTIGWGHVGILWDKPFFIAYIRKSRYTHDLIEETGDFTINIPPKNFNYVTEFCGTKSGRYVDKVKELGLKIENSKFAKSPSLSECPITLECKVIFGKEIELSNIPSNIKNALYTRNDYHTCYFSEIVNLVIR